MEGLARLRGLARSPAVALAVLVAANAVPVLGVLFLGWDAVTLLVLYWLENGVVGLVNIFKIATAEGPIVAHAPGLGMSLQAFGAGSGALVKALTIPFFVLHYGMFWAVHGIFVFLLPTMFGIRRAVVGHGPASLPVVLDGSDFPALPAFDASGLWLAALVLLVSHVISFRIEWIGRGEYRNVSPWRQAMQPYARVFILHFVIVFGGVLVFAIGQPLALLLLLVVLKTGLDVVLHVRAHARARTPPVVAS